VRAPQQVAVTQRRRSQVADEQQHLAPFTVGIQATPWLGENGGERFPFLTQGRIAGVAGSKGLKMLWAWR
jgi:hypothetical protein